MEVDEDGKISLIENDVLRFESLSLLYSGKVESGADMWTGFIAAGVSGLLTVVEILECSSALSAAGPDIEVAFRSVGKSSLTEATHLKASLRLDLMVPFLEKVSRETLAVRERKYGLQMGTLSPLGVMFSSNVESSSA